MSDNPLSGLQIPSLKDIADEVVERMGSGVIDLANPLQRKRLKDYIEQAVGMAVTFELERALHAATDRAITHVFNVMRDENYQEKKRTRRIAAQAKRLEARKQKDIAEREARMDYSKSHLEVSKRTIQ